MFGTYLGDFIHNARSALDNLVCAMILRNDPDHPIEHAAFPAYDGKKKWISEIVGRNRNTDGPAPTDGVSADVLAAIERSQPYNIKGMRVQRAPLFLLQAASNTDKHRTIYAAGAVIAPRSTFPGSIEAVPPGYFRLRQAKIAAPGSPYETGTEIGRAKVRISRRPPPDAEVGVYVRLPLDITFSVEGKREVLTQRDIWPMMNDVWRVVLRVEKAAGITGLPLPLPEWDWQPEES